MSTDYPATDDTNELVEQLIKLSLPPKPKGPHNPKPNPYRGKNRSQRATLIGSFAAMHKFDKRKAFKL